MLSEILADTTNNLLDAKHKKKHPFRFFTLTTVTKEHHPKSRTVVLRDFDKAAMTFTIFTDGRSQKVTHLVHNKKVQLLFYDPKKLLQVIVSAHLKEQLQTNDVFLSLPEPSKKDYTSAVAPGEMIKTPDGVQYDLKSSHFTQLLFKADEIEILRLKRPNHIRCVYTSTENTWEGRFLAP